MKKISVLGSTGSIGRQTLAVVEALAGQFCVVGLAAGSNLEELVGQIERHRPEVVSVATAERADTLAKRLREKGIVPLPALHNGREGMLEVGTHAGAEIVVSAAVGVVGLEATYEAIKLGKTIALSNKEVLVAAGELVMAAVEKSGKELLPVDSEHNGAHQCLRAGNRAAVSRLILTASGGPFRNTPPEALRSVTPEQALNHPTWRMGNRITIDSATLMNKGFEVIEACWLFDFAPSQVDVVIHPQSSVHAMIEYSDGSVLAQISATDMRMPIQYALTYPERCDAPVPKIDWTEARKWEFLPPDYEKFPLLKLAYQCLEAGGAATCTLNAADEIAVEAFLEGRIAFPSIYEVVSETLAGMPARNPESIGDILEIDRESRAMARTLVAARAGAVTA